MKDGPPLQKDSELSYQSGFGNEFASEALPGTLPSGQNSPQHVAHGLYAEVISGTAFTAPRATNRRTWMYRARPTAAQNTPHPLDAGMIRGTPFNECEPTPERLRWSPESLPVSGRSVDFIAGLATYAGSGDIEAQRGCAAHLYCTNASMQRAFCNADGELLIVPQLGPLLIETELGRLRVAPGEIGVIPRGVKFRVLLLDGPARGYVCENYGQMLRLPELGPIGSNGLANPRDFLAPVAWFEEPDTPTEVVTKFLGKLWTAKLAHSPFDVVAWHGNYVPYKYDLAHFNAIGSVSFDHPDPSILTVLTSPSEIAGTANVDFVIFPPRWIVAEHTFRPPWYHRNVMSEFMGLVQGVYEAKTEGFLPGGASLHNCMLAHGPDAASHARAATDELKPEYRSDTLAFMFESRYLFRPTRHAMHSAQRQRDYEACWTNLPTPFKAPEK